MKKIIFLFLLISGGAFAQIPAPRSTTTFSNVNAVGSMTVGGNLKVGGAITSPTVYGSSAASSDLNVFSTSNSTRGVLRLNSPVAITTNTTSQNLFSVTSTLTASSGLGVTNLFNSYFNSGNATQHGVAFFSANSVASQTNITQANGLLTALYHYNPFTIPEWQGVESGGAFVDGAGASITNCWGLSGHLPSCTNGGSVTNAAGLYIPSMSNTGITNAYAIYSPSSYNSLFGGGIYFAATTGTNSGYIRYTSNKLILKGGISGFNITNSADAVKFTLDDSGNGVFSGAMTCNGGIQSNGATNTNSFAGPINSTITYTLVNGSVSGTANFAQPFRGASYKKVMIYLAALNGTASFTFNTAFTNTPVVLSTNGLATTKVTSLTTTSVTVTGATDTGFLIIEGY